MRLALLALLLADTAHAGPWVDDAPGHGFVQLSYTRYAAEHYFSGPGEVDDRSRPVASGTRRPIKIPAQNSQIPSLVDSNYTEQSLALYGEVSLWRGLAAVVAMPLLRDLTQDVHLGLAPAQLSQRNVGDLSFGLKQQLPRIRALPGLALGPQVFLTAPTGDKNGRATYPSSLTDPPKPLPLPTGNGTWDVELRGSFGYSFHPVPVFLVADVGFRHHTTTARCHAGATEDEVHYSDDLPWDVQAGATWDVHRTLHTRGFDRVVVIANLVGLHSFENGDVPGKNGLPGRGSPYTQTCGQANNQSSLSFGGTVVLFPVRFIGVTYTVARTLTGVNTGIGLANSVGIATTF